MSIEEVGPVTATDNLGVANNSGEVMKTYYITFCNKVNFIKLDKLDSLA